MSEQTIPAHEHRLLLEAVVGEERARHRPVTLTDDEQARLADLIERRISGVPLQHLTGLAYFRYETLHVGPGVFIPRPETEVMTGWVIDRLRERGGDQRVVELCGGSGAISRAIAREYPSARQWVVELSEEALPWLRRNLAGTEVEAVEGDMAEALHELDGTVDVVVVNPPYVPLDAFEGLPVDVRDHDPAMALFSGEDGLDAMHVVEAVAARLLKPGGLLAAEHAEVQHGAVELVIAGRGNFTHVVDHVDLTGRWRFVTGERMGA